MNEFKTYHPIVNFTYFIFIIGFSCVFMHPFCLLISLFGAFSYSALLKGKKGVMKNLMYIIPMIIVMALINPCFNHEGATILKYLPGGNPLTLESIYYGISAGIMISSVICWFSCYNEVMTSDKFIYIFGKIIPSLSLVLSMTLRFVPRFSEQMKATINAQKCIGKSISNGNIIKRAKNGLSILSVMTTWALENSIETADSMKSRGYGLLGRTSFSIFKFDKRDFIALFFILLFGIYTIAGGINGGMYFSYFPVLSKIKVSFYSISVFMSYLMLCSFPVIIELVEARKWNVIK